MKKILFILSIFILFLVSCEVEPNVPDCEKYGYGDVTVTNSTGYTAWVDVTYGINDVNYERKLYNSHSYSYEMDEGKVYIWISFDGSDWVYQTRFLYACENLKFTWYYNNGIVLDTGNGELVSPLRINK